MKRKAKTNSEQVKPVEQAEPVQTERRARALLDIPALGVKCGEFFNAPADQVDELVKAGVADDKADEKAAKA